jgi:hypothetical protein
LDLVLACLSILCEELHFHRVLQDQSSKNRLKLTGDIWNIVYQGLIGYKISIVKQPKVN